MKIKLTYKKFPFYFWMPMGLIKSSFIQKRLDLSDYYDVINVILPEIKKYIKRNGHFVLLEINTQENIRIIIKV